MPEVRMGTFHHRHGGAVGTPATFFRWEDDPTEDAAFVEYVNQGPASNASIDRSTSHPALIWEDGSAVVHTQYAGKPGTHWHNNFWNPTTGDQGPAVFDVSGYWKCDVYGRPFDLNDLLA